MPPVFPIVLYNGEPRWTAKRELSELIEPYPASLEAYRPSQRYFLLDEGRIGEVDLKQAEGIVAEIIRLESSQEPDVWREIIGRLTARLKEKRYDSLRRALVIWITRNVLKRVVPEDNIPEITELQEIDNMLAERADKWVEKWKQQGLEQGLQQGEGKIVIRQIQKRFGQPPKWVEEKIANATEEQLEHWADSILEATSLEEVFGE